MHSVVATCDVDAAIVTVENVVVALVSALAIDGDAAVICADALVNVGATVGVDGGTTESVVVSPANENMRTVEIK